jgi:DNA-binding NarL/FixJ family response regulator
MSASPLIRVVVIHHDPLVRACIANELGERPAFVVAQVLEDADHFGDPRFGSSGGVIVADHDAAIRLAGSTMQRHLLPQTQPPIVLVSSCDREWELRSAMERRVRGYLSPGFDVEQLVACVQAVQRGARYLCQRTSARLAESLAFESLTERETTVLRLVVRGLPNKSIGPELDISLGTVKSHLKSAYAKLQVTSRTQAIAEAQRRGLLEHAAEHAAPRPAPARATMHAFAPASRVAQLASSGVPELRAA